MLLGCAESSLQVVVGVGLGEFAEVHKIRPGQGHRAGGQQAGSRASGQAGKKTSLPEPHPGEGHNPSKEERCVCRGARHALLVRACVNMYSCVLIAGPGCVHKPVALSI